MLSLTKKSLSILTIALLCGAFSLSFAGQWVSFDGSSEADIQTAVVSSDNSATILEIDIRGMFVENVDVDGEIFQDLKFHSFGSTQDVGLPALPLLAELLAIPGMSNVRVTILSEETVTFQGYKIAPFQTPTTDKDPAAEFVIDRAFYGTDAYYPAERTSLGEIGVMRDLRVAPVRVVPFQYNPVTQELIVSTRLTVKVEYYGVSDQAVQTETLSETNPRLAQWYRSAITNYDELNIPENRQTDEFQVKYLFVVTAEAIPVIQPLVDLRNAQGLGAEVRELGPGFSSTTDIRDYIHSLYVTDGLEYVLMVGDFCPATGHTIMPMHYWSNTYSDSWFTMIDPWPNTGNDYLADLSIGRIVYDNLTELQLQMDKTMGYLLDPATTDNWAEHSLLVAHSEQYPLKYTQCKEEIRTFPYAIQTPIFGQAYGGAGATNADVINYLNTNGSGILNYRGHGSQTEWWSWGPSGGFGWDEIAQLTNQDKLFVHFDVCCDNMDFPGYSGPPNGNCFAESFMKHEFGCVALHSAIVPSYTIPNHDYDKEFYKAIYHEGIVNIGYAANFANITVYAVHGSIGESNIRTYLWLGDSAIDPWTDTPQEMAVDHMPIMYLGWSTFDVDVQIGGSFVENAMVCMQNENYYVTGYTDAAGHVTLDFGGAVSAPGILTLTVSAHNGLTYQTDIDVIPSEGPYVVFNQVDINDSGAWMPNGQLDFGEDVLLSLTLENVGIEGITDVNAVITSPDPYITIIDGAEIYPNIAAYSTTMIPNGYEIEVSPDVPDNHPIAFVLTATAETYEWQSNFSIIAHAPVVAFERLNIEDPTGNQNNQLDPGETVDFEVIIINSGSTDATNIEVNMTTGEPLVTIPVTVANIAALAAGEETTITYTGITADASMSNGTVVEFALDITADGGYWNEGMFAILVGDERYQPSGPDNYGYLAYDMYDSPAVFYDWFEIAPMAGGPGSTQIFGDDQTRQVNLPFSFMYYGNSFTQISICSNGWVAMGYQTTTDYSNSGIPNSDGPNNMIAPFWDDLNPNNGGQIAWYHDVAGHRFLIEFYHIPHYSGGGIETFQVVLYDPAFHFSPTGDGNIMVNYHTPDNATSCTAGIENGSENDGIEFLYNTAYDPFAMPLESGFAIMFTTGLTMPEMSVTLTPPGTPIVIPAAGGSFDYDVDITNTGTGIASFSAWIDVTLPDGTQTGPLLLRTGLSLPAGASIIRDMTQNIPGFAPEGDYIYWLHVGGYPGNIIAEDSFPFEKSGVDGSSSLIEWTVEGWGLDNSAALDEIPANFYLAQNYPNPFNPQTTFDFGLPDDGLVTLTIYNILGREVAKLVDGKMEAGNHSVLWNAQAMSSGVYFYQLKTESKTQIKKCILMK